MDYNPLNKMTRDYNPLNKMIREGCREGGGVMKALLYGTLINTYKDRMWGKVIEGGESPTVTITMKTS